MQGHRKHIISKARAEMGQVRWLLMLLRSLCLLLHLCLSFTVSVSNYPLLCWKWSFYINQLVMLLGSWFLLLYLCLSLYIFLYPLLVIIMLTMVITSYISWLGYLGHDAFYSVCQSLTLSYLLSSLSFVRYIMASWRVGVAVKGCGTVRRVSR